MPDAEISSTSHSSNGDTAVLVRKRPKPGERRVQILQALASMLEQPGAERITTAALAARLDVSEAALYRHFASKAQMFEGLIEFIEQTVFSLVNQIAERDGAAAAPDGTNDAGSALSFNNGAGMPGFDNGAGVRRAGKVAAMLIQFAEKNPGMTRVMVGDALVFENERLQQRMNQFFDKIESIFRQNLRGAAHDNGSGTPSVDAQVSASVLTAFLVGRLQRYARSGFKRLPSEHLEASLAQIL
jgi:TetR/AcrR family transcriptional regulator